MSDATGTDAAHPALVTATGPAAGPGGDDATGTDAHHPAVVTRLAFEPAAAPHAPTTPAPKRTRTRRRRRKRRRQR